MKLMLDTHMLAWFAGNRGQLSVGERAAIAAHSGELLVSAISIWEIRLKWRSSPRKAAADLLIKPQAALLFCAARDIPIVPFTADDAAFDVVPSPRHKDPFDGTLLGHAHRAGATLLTRDPLLVDHPLAYHS